MADGKQVSCAAALASLSLIASTVGASWRVEKLEPSPAFPVRHVCDATRWHQDIVKERGLAIIDPLCADLRGDGRERMYASLSEGPVVEMELMPDGPRTSETLIDEPNPGLASAPLSIAPYKPGANPSLFVGGAERVNILTWNDGRWERESLPTGDGSGLSGIAFGDARGDGRARIYTAFDGSLAEYSPTPLGWHRQVFSPRLGMIRRLAIEKAAGRSATALRLETDHGVYSLRWRNEGRVAVLDFDARNRSPEEATGFSDLLRTRLFQIGNCRVLERSAVVTLLRERALQSAGLLDPASASRAATLLGADRIIIGSLGREAEKNFADVRIVSSRTGTASRSEYVVWNSDAEMEKAVELLAQAACPDTSRPP